MGVRSGATVTIFTFTDQIEEVTLRRKKKERKKEVGKWKKVKN